MATLSSVYILMATLSFTNAIKRMHKNKNGGNININEPQIS